MERPRKASVAEKGEVFGRFGGREHVKMKRLAEEFSVNNFDAVLPYLPQPLNREY